MAQIGVDHADDLRRRRGKTFDDGRTEPELAGAMYDGDREAERQPVGDVAGAIRRVVVDDDELTVDAARGVGGEDRPHELWKPFAFVVSGDDECKRRGRGCSRWQGMGSPAL
jgi:hypothetical protein